MKPEVQEHADSPGSSATLGREQLAVASFRQRVWSISSAAEKWGIALHLLFHGLKHQLFLVFAWKPWMSAFLFYLFHVGLLVNLKFKQDDEDL